MNNIVSSENYSWHCSLKKKKKTTNNKQKQISAMLQSCSDAAEGKQDDVVMLTAQMV